MRQADYNRSLDRGRINELFDGFPPYTDAEVRDNKINVNVNWLEATRLAHDARSQFAGAFLKPGKYFTSTTDMGPRSKRQERSVIVTREVNRIMKRSQHYFETFRSKFASNVLHGITPVCWDGESKWCPDMIGVGDVLIPGRTYLTMQNLPFLAIYHSYTARELIKLTRGPKVDPAWNMDLVERLLEWIDKETLALMSNNWPEIWSPEKAEQRIKGDGAFYTADSVPTIDVWDLYAWEDDGKRSGWERRMVLDSWSAPQSPQNTALVRNAKLDFAKGKWLYNSGRRKFGSKLSEIICFQFADLSAVPPFQYHNVRSLGYLEYAVCHIQNRLRCKVTEAVFENLMMLLRVKSLDDVERALKINLFHLGILDETATIVPQAERHQINTQLVQLGLSENARLINENSQSYRSNGSTEDDRTRRTKFEVMSELNATTALVQAGLAQSYEYQRFEYNEIFRRFCRKNSRDPEVREFRAACLKQKIPEEMLVAEAWTHEPERVMGAGNKALELQIAQQLMQYRQLYDPDPQRQILRDVTLAITDDPGRAMALVPEQQNKVTESVHDAQLAAAALLTGIMMGLKQGVNHQEYAATLLKVFQQQIQKIGRRGGVATPDELMGLQNLAGQTIQGQPIGGNGIMSHLQILAQDEEAKPLVKQLGDQLGKLMNEVKAFAQRLQEQQQKAQEQNGNGQMDPKDKAKIQATVVSAQVKAENARQSHAQRTAQRQLQWEQEMEQRQQEHAQEMREKHLEQAHDLAINRIQGMQSLSEDHE